MTSLSLYFLCFLIYKVETISLFSQVVKKKETVTENHGGLHRVGARKSQSLLPLSQLLWA